MSVSKCNIPANGIVTKDSRFLCIHGQKAGKSVISDAFLFPLKEKLVQDGTYQINYEVFSGCDITTAFDFSNDLPCFKSGEVYHGINPVVDCNGLKWFLPQIVVDKHNGIGKWAEKNLCFVAKDTSKYLIVRQGSQNNPISQQPNSAIPLDFTYSYYDNIEVTPKPQGDTVTYEVLRSCIGGVIEIKYKICAKDGFKYDVEISPDANSLVAGVSFSSFGDFPDGTPKTITLNDKPNTKCVELLLVLKTDNTLSVGQTFTVISDFETKNICDSISKKTIGVPIKMTGEDPNFTVDMNNCPKLIAIPVVNNSNAGHSWSVTDKITSIVVFTSSTPILDIPVLKPGEYTISHTLNFSCGSTTTTRDIKMDCPNYVCSCDNNLLTGNTVLLSTTDFYKINQKGLINSCLFLKGTLVIDVNYVFDNVQIKSFSASSIIVNSAKRLTIRNQSVLEGCPLMWQGIQVQTGAICDISNSTIRDALTGVQLADKSFVKIHDNKFILNRTGIEISDNGLSTKQILFSLPGSIGTPNFIGNHFFGGKGVMLKDPSITTKYPLYGIACQNSILNIGKNSTPLTTYKANTFEEIRIGIAAYNSDIKVENAKFYTLSDEGIVVGNKSNLQNLNNAYFDDMPIAMHTGLQASIKTTKEVHIDKVVNGIGAVNASFVQIEDCHITAAANAINVIMPVPSKTQPSYIRKCVLSNYDAPNNNGGNYSFGQDVSLSINQTNFDKLPTFMVIEDNTINNGTFKDSEWAIGMQISNSNSMKLLRNTINGGTLNPSKTSGWGLHVGDCSQIRLKENNINGNQVSSFQSIGFLNQFNNNLRLCCSKINGARFGFNSSMVNTDFLMRNTDFDKNEYGIYCNQTSSFSIQVSGNNRWNGTYPGNGQGAQHGAGYSANPSLKQYIIASEIRVDAPFANNSIEWAQNSIYPALVSPGNNHIGNWFNPTSFPSFSCSADPECNAPKFKMANKGENEKDEFVAALTTNDTMAATGFYQTAAYGNIASWQVARNLFEKLKENSFLLEGNKMMDSFYHVTNETNIARFQEVENAIDDLNVIDDLEKEQLIAAEGQITYSTDNIQSYEELLNETKDKEEIKLYEDAIREEREHLLSATERRELVLSEIAQKRIERTAQIKELNHTINSQSLWEKNEKIVNEIWLDILADEKQEMNIEQANQLAAIAFQCEIVSGGAVLTARSLYQLWQYRTFIPEEYCESYRIKGTVKTGSITNDADGRSDVQTPTSNKISKYTLAPNPTQGELNVLIPTYDEKANYQLSIHSLSGQEILRKPLLSERELLDIQVLNTGIYFCRIVKDNKTVDTQKLIIIK